MDTAFATLLDALSLEDRTSRVDAALALAKAKDARAVPALIAVIEASHDQDELVYGAPPHAIYALGEIGDARAVDALVASLGTRLLAGKAVEALEKIGDERGFAAILEYFKTNPAGSIASVLARWGDKRAVPALIQAMRSEDAHVRFYSARALGRLGDASALPALELARLDDTVPLPAKGSRGKSVADVAAVAIQNITKARR